VPSSHDQLFHFLFCQPRSVAGFLKAVLPARVVTAIEWDSLAIGQEHIPGVRLRTHRADLVFRTRRRGNDGQVWLLLEHKSVAEPHWRAQVLRYVVHLRRVVQKSGEHELPVIVPMLVYHGTEPLDPPPGDPTPFDVFEPRLRVVVVDLDQTPPSALSLEIAPMLRLGLHCLHAVGRFSSAQLLAAIDDWAELWRAVENDPGPPMPEDVLDALGWYLVEHSDLSEETVGMTISKHLQQPEGMKMTTGQRIRIESRNLGRAEGRVEGRVEGRAEGRAESLLRLLAKRFGPVPTETSRRIQAATIPELDRWTDRVLDAPTLAAVLAD
jgi:predicted transposase/invertase (TIGR01784 family)